LSECHFFSDDFVSSPGAMGHPSVSVGVRRYQFKGV
jgi:hypothetical protein